jgi:hypothetical protein
MVASMSVSKFFNRHVYRGKRLHWHRSSEDGLPYRGEAAPMYTQDEFEERVVRVADPRSEVFDLSDERQKALYLEVLDGITNGWFQCLHRQFHYPDRRNPRQVFVHLEWVEYFMEDGHPVQYLSPGVMELASNGRSHGLPPSG